MDKKTLKIITRRVLEYSNAVNEEGRDKDGLETHIDALAEVFGVSKDEVTEIANQVIDSRQKNKTFKEYVSQNLWKIILVILFFISILAMGILISKIHFLEDRTISHQNPIAARSSSFSLASMAVDPNNTQYIHKAIFSQILGSIMPVRMSVVEYLMMEGDYPKQLKDIGLKRETMKFVKYIQDLKLGVKGQIIINTTERLGQGIYITYTPKKVMGGLNIEWQCQTNYQQSKLYICEQLDIKELLAEEKLAVSSVKTL